MTNELHLKRLLSPKQADLLNAKKAIEMPYTINEPTHVFDASNGDLILAFQPAPDVHTLRKHILSTTMTTTYRSSSGMSNVSRTFGMAPRKPTQWREGCAPTSMSRDHPEASAYLAYYAELLAEEMNAFVPKQVQADEQTIQQVLPEWRLTEQALWTSGVINKSSQLAYHRDKFNFDAWSAMVCLRRGTRGGYLHLPEYGMVLSCRDGYAAYWSGYRLLHGVTPIQTIQPDGYRFTVVYYALRGMKDCHTHAVEQEYAREKRTGREHAGD